jgi:uncharacterized peroxidase-related enzyme
MRLEAFRTRAVLSSRIIARLVQFVAGFHPDIVRVLLYRKDFFGDTFNAGFYATLRAESEWSVGERELMAAFVSEKNQCRYCTDVHRTTAARYLGDQAVSDALDDPKERGIPEKLRATLAFLEKLTVSPKDVSAEHVAAMRRAGVTDEGIRCAAAICSQFCIVNRLADTFGFERETPRQLANHAKTLTKRNYRL